MKFHVGLITFLIAPSTITHAFRVDVYGQRRILTEPRIIQRADINGVQLNDSADISYYANVSLGGKTFQLLVDTGSSDLWAAGNVPNASSTNFTASVNYASGSVQGPVKTARLDLDGQTVLDQAFLAITPDSNNKDGSGILGLGPNSGSNIYTTVSTVAGAAVVDRIFLQNMTTPNFISVILGRSDDPTDPFPGSITIGEILSGFENVVNQPKLPVTTVVQQQKANQHFQVLLDENGLIGPDGQPIPLHTNITSTPNKNQATVVFDTGFSLPQLPKSAVDAIYSRFRGAELKNIDDVGQLWILPCTQEVNVTFKFAGQRYPIHPLDATLNPSLVGLSNVTNSKGQKSCIGTFQPVSFDTGSVPSYDMVLGMAFLRNVYMVMNYGDFIVGSTNKANPYMQFLSVTDPAEAHTDFVKVRLNGVDTTMNDGLLDLGNSGLSSRSIGLIVAAVTIVVILAAVVGFLIYRRNHQTRRRIVDIGSSLTSHSSSQKEEFGLLTSPLAYRMPRDSYDDPFQRRPNIPSYAPNSIRSQYHPHQQPHKKR